MYVAIIVRKGTPENIFHAIKGRGMESRMVMFKKWKIILI